jgi:hypothetical protein
MKRITVTMRTAAVAALLLAGSAQAAPPIWNYNWTPSTTTVMTDSPIGADSKIKLTDQLTNNQAQSFSTDITATNITVDSDAPPGFPDEFVASPSVNFKLRIYDGAVVDGIFKDFTFTGHFNTVDPLNPSTVADGEANVDFTPTGDQSITQVIGSHEYTVSYNSYTPPPPEGTKDTLGNLVQGSISYHVTVRELDIQKAPEPSSMLLAGIGASFLGFGAWRKRRQQTAA